MLILVVHSTCRCRCTAGAGVIVHMDDTVGLVLTDRNTVVVAPGDVTVSFCAHPGEAPARVRFVHPLHNWTMVSFNVADLPLEVRRLNQKIGLPPQALGLRNRLFSWPTQLGRRSTELACWAWHVIHTCICSCDSVVADG